MESETREPVVLGTRDGYDRWAAHYDGYANPLIALEEPVVRSFMGDVAGLELLDLATGTGRHARWMVERGARVTGVDFSSGMLERARSSVGEATWITHDLHAPLPFADGVFDGAVHGLALDHLDDPAALLRELFRVLRPGARAAISLMHPAMFLRGTQARFVDPDSGDLVVIDNRRHSIADLVNAVRVSGLELVDIQEATCPASLTERIPRAEKYIGWPMLLFLGVARG